MDGSTLPLTGLSPVSGKRIDARFDGGLLSSDGGILLLREVEQRLGVADHMAACINDPRAPDHITHSLADIIRFRLMMIAAGYEDGNDASSLRIDPAFKMALGLAPSDRALCSQPTISRLENLPDTRALLHIGRAMVDLYCESFRTVPRRIVLDIDDTFDAVHGGQQLRLFNAHHDEYGFQPIVVFDGEGRFITAVLRPAKRPGGKEIRAFLRRLMRAIRANWPKTQILLRGDSHYCCPEVIDWCRAGGHEFILGAMPTSTLRRHIADLEVSTKARFDAAPQAGKARRFKSFHDGAKSWSRVERIIARVEVGEQGADTRFVVTNLKKGSPRRLYEQVYCRRGQAENHIKSWKTHLAADRTSCTRATANQLRLFLHAGAYWLMWGLRSAMPKRSTWRTAQFDTLRLRLIKVAARVTELKTLIRIQWPTACPDQKIFRLALDRVPRLVT
ncbi:IS1380 family transposase [Novosphingobium sp. 18050]|uniref:IS1380 family transposase n=1 Tax=Novosphingobium sp. 18050 TaxID=2681398 RepID=UPI00135850B3|nr:IS1380 family transposase [Novosphingobium sp. 18050]